jgi:chemotaxis signal transduction protein
MSAPTVELLVFRVGEVRYGADASQVTRITRAGHRSRLSDALGMPREGTRALVFAEPGSSGGERELCIDAVDGILTAPVEQLRRLPPAAGRVDAVLGLWLEEGERPLVLVDLLRTLDLPGGSP